MAKQGGSAIKRLKQNLKASGIIGPNSLAKKASKKSSKKSQAAAQEARKTSRDLLRAMSVKQQSANPFELKHSKPKHEVLGRRIKGVTGRPGATNKKAEDLRRKTIAVEMRRKNKETALIDRRIGENDPNMSMEDRMLERLIREKTSKSNSLSSSIFNLQEEEDLTHLGQSLSNMDDFEAAGLTRVASDDDEGNIDAEMVKQIHFGGFEDQKDENRRKSRAEIMHEVISKSKMHKRERQKQKEDDLDLQDQVDAELDEIRGLLTPMSEGKMVISNDRLKLINGEPSTPNNPPVEVAEVEFNPPAVPDDAEYDKFVRELQFDRRGKPTDRIRSDEEVARLELQKLEQLEKERIDRMLGLSDNQHETKKRRAQGDDLDDADYDAFYEAQEQKEKEVPLTYKDGKLVDGEIFLSNHAKAKLAASESGSEDSSDDDDNDDGNDRVVAGREGSLEPEFEYEEPVDSEGDAMYESYSEDEEESSGESESDSVKESNSKPDAADEIPYVFDAPKTLDELLKLIDGLSTDLKPTLLKRMRILFNPRLGGEAKEKLRAITLLLLEYRDYLVSKPVPDVLSLAATEENIVEMCRYYSFTVSEVAIMRIVEMQSRLVKSLTKNAKRQVFLCLSDLYFLDLMGKVYSTSDFDHPVITPAMLVMSQYLAQCPVQTAQDAVAGLFICQIYYEYVSLSKRYVPEVVNFLHRLCATCLSVAPESMPSSIPLLHLISPKFAIDDFCAEPHAIQISQMPRMSKASSLTEETKMTFVCHAFEVLDKYCRLWNESGSTIEIFSTSTTLMHSHIPDQLNEKAKSILDAVKVNMDCQMASAVLKRKPLQMQKRKAMPIKTYVPKFEENYSHDRRLDPDVQRAQDAKLRAQVKKEKKGATRELRKDAAFIARQQLEETKVKDAEYKKKIAKIMGQLASQEGAMRGYEREAKKPKRR